MLNALLRLGELSCRKVIVILIGEQGWDTFCSTARHAARGHLLSAYTKEEVRYILLRERPSDADETLYNGFLSFMLSTFHATCRNLHELRAALARSGRSTSSRRRGSREGRPSPRTSRAVRGVERQHRAPTRRRRRVAKSQVKRAHGIDGAIESGGARVGRGEWRASRRRRSGSGDVWTLRFRASQSFCSWLRISARTTRTRWTNVCLAVKSKDTSRSARGRIAAPRSRARRRRRSRGGRAQSLQARTSHRVVSLHHSLRVRRTRRRSRRSRGGIAQRRRLHANIEHDAARHALHQPRKRHGGWFVPMQHLARSRRKTSAESRRQPRNLSQIRLVVKLS